MTISELLNKLILAAIHYRNRELIVNLITSVNNHNKFYKAADELETQKNAILTAIRDGEYLN